MATATIAHLYNSDEDSAQTVRDLKAAGIATDEISLITKHSDNPLGADGPGSTKAGEGASAGASLGAILGAGAGLLAGFGVVAIPGIGPVIAAGWLVATATGAAAGAAAVGMLGLLIGAGMNEEEANVTAECVRRGGTLISVRVDEDRSAIVEEIMRRNRSADPLELGRSYRADGWRTFDEPRH